MKRILVFLCALLCLGACNRESGEMAKQASLFDQVQANSELRVGVKADSPPFGFAMGQDIYAGFEIDIIQALARELGIKKLIYVPVASNDRINAITDGKVDVVIANMSTTRTRDKLVDFTIPYFRDGQLLLVKEGSDISSYLDLSGKSVACIKGSTGTENLTIVAPNAKLLVCENNEQMLEALRSGKADALTNDGIVLEGMRNKNKADKLKVVGEHFSDELLAIALPENQSDLRDALNEGLQRLWETGEWHSVYEAWFGPGSGYKHVEQFHMETFPR